MRLFQQIKSATHKTCTKIALIGACTSLLSFKMVLHAGLLKVHPYEDYYRTNFTNHIGAEFC